MTRPAPTPTPPPNVVPTIGTGLIPCPGPGSRTCSTRRRDMFLTTGRPVEARDDGLPVIELRCRSCHTVFDYVDSTTAQRAPGTIGARRLEAAPEQYAGGGWPRA